MSVTWVTMVTFCRELLCRGSSNVAGSHSSRISFLATEVRGLVPHTSRYIFPPLLPQAPKHPSILHSTILWSCYVVFVGFCLFYFYGRAKGIISAARFVYDHSR